MADAGTGRILVVDDDRLVLATLTHGLAQAGHTVFSADNGDEAILLARQHRPDLALLDIRMEGMSGFDVAAYLREHLRVPFMFLSAFADDETARKVRALGAVAYLMKPLDIGHILPAVAEALAHTRARLAPRAADGADNPAAQAGLHAPGGGAAVPVDSGRDAAARGHGLGDGPAAANVAAAWLAPVALAVGILMHRYSLSRQAALARLQRLADTEGRPLQEQAARLLDAVELLARGQ